MCLCNRGLNGISRQNLRPFPPWPCFDPDIRLYWPGRFRTSNRYLSRFLARNCCSLSNIVHLRGYLRALSVDQLQPQQAQWPQWDTDFHQEVARPWRDRVIEKKDEEMAWSCLHYTTLEDARGIEWYRYVLFLSDVTKITRGKRPPMSNLVLSVWSNNTTGIQTSHEAHMFAEMWKIISGMGTRLQICCI